MGSMGMGQRLIGGGFWILGRVQRGNIVVEFLNTHFSLAIVTLLMLVSSFVTRNQCCPLNFGDLSREFEWKE
jgi:S-adenosylmethionine:tRNA-ribosyltransferase-isomerase (queuine synthetase)